MTVGDVSLSGLRSGDLVDITVAMVSPGFYTGWWHGDRFFIEGLGAGTWTLFDYRFVSVRDGVGVLEQTVDSYASQKPALSHDSFITLIETCSGLGGISIGAHFAGFRTLVFNDKASIACRTVELNHGVVVEGDTQSRKFERR